MNYIEYLKNKNAQEAATLIFFLFLFFPKRKVLHPGKIIEIFQFQL